MSKREKAERELDAGREVPCPGCGEILVPGANVHECASCRSACCTSCTSDTEKGIVCDPCLTDAYGNQRRIRIAPITEGHIKGRRTEPEWFTPPSLFVSLFGENYETQFDLDPCSPVEGPVPWVPARHFLTKEDDGLRALWGIRRVFMNPPYGNLTAPFLERFMDHGDGIALVAARTDPEWFHQQATRADALLFLSGRLSYWERLCIGCGHGASKHTTAILVGEKGPEACKGCGRRGCTEFEPHPPDVRDGYGPSGSPGSGQILLAAGEWATEILRKAERLGWLVDQRSAKTCRDIIKCLADVAGI